MVMEALVIAGAIATFVITGMLFVLWRRAARTMFAAVDDRLAVQTKVMGLWFSGISAAAVADARAESAAAAQRELQATRRYDILFKLVMGFAVVSTFALTGLGVYVGGR